jgi:hypothetical protein
LNSVAGKPVYGHEIILKQKMFNSSVYRSTRQEARASVENPGHSEFNVALLVPAPKETARIGGTS